MAFTTRVAPATLTFFLTFNGKNLIYKSHCDLLIANSTFRENQSMKYKTAKKEKSKGKTAKPKAATKTATKKPKKTPKKH